MLTSTFIDQNWKISSIRSPCCKQLHEGYPSVITSHKKITPTQHSQNWHCMTSSGAVEPERSGTPLQHLFFSRNAQPHEPYNGTWTSWQFWRSVCTTQFRHLNCIVVDVNGQCKPITAIDNWALVKTTPLMTFFWRHQVQVYTIANPHHMC